MLNFPEGIRRSTPQVHLYIADTENMRIRKADAFGGDLPFPPASVRSSLSRQHQFPVGPIQSRSVTSRATGRDDVVLGTTSKQFAADPANDYIDLRVRPRSPTARSPHR
jgi:hypothetical protein